MHGVMHIIHIFECEQKDNCCLLYTSKVNYVKLTAGVLTGFMALSSVPYAVYAAGPTAGVASYTSDIVSLSLIHI